MPTLKGMTPQQFADHLESNSTNASFNWWEIQDYLRENAETAFHLLGGEEGVTKWAIAQYDRFCAPVDIPWLAEEIEQQVIDAPARHLITAGVKRLHDLLHRTPPITSV